MEGTMKQGNYDLSNPMSGGSKRQGSKGTASKVAIAGGLVLLVALVLFATQSQPVVVTENNAKDPMKQVQNAVTKKATEDQISTPTKQMLILKTSKGPIRIVLRPDLSPETIPYMEKLLAQEENCPDCKFYRAEKPGIFQGILAHPDVPKGIERLGPCPPGVDPPKNCPSHDKNCACHGPIMTKGMVGWAGGGGGPDFFINTYPTPVTFWESTHTVWGEITDEASLKLIDDIYELPTTQDKPGAMIFLEEKIPFTLEMKQE